jgi:hypothetical protein
MNTAQDAEYSNVTGLGSVDLALKKMSFSREIEDKQTNKQMNS